MTPDFSMAYFSLPSSIFLSFPKMMLFFIVSLVKNCDLETYQINCLQSLRFLFIFCLLKIILPLFGFKKPTIKSTNVLLPLPLSP